MSNIYETERQRDIPGMDGKTRTNRTGTAKGNGEWRLQFRKLASDVKGKLREMTALCGRD